MKHILGVDAAWSITNPSGVTLLECSAKGKPRLLRAGRSYEEFQTGEIIWKAKPKGTCTASEKQHLASLQSSTKSSK